MARLMLGGLAVDINPNGRNYASGAEDGYVRLHHFDKDYLDMKDQVPEEGEDDDDDDGDINNDNDEEEEDAVAATPTAQ